MSRILIIDDHSTFHHIFGNVLKGAGHEVLYAEDGRAGIGKLLNELIQKRNKIDLILLDISMPVMDGFETCKKIRSTPITQKIPVIFLTSLMDKDSVMKARQAGGNDYFLKTGDPNLLLSKVNKILSPQPTSQSG